MEQPLYVSRGCLDCTVTHFPWPTGTGGTQGICPVPSHSPIRLLLWPEPCEACFYRQTTAAAQLAHTMPPTDRSNWSEWSPHTGLWFGVSCYIFNERICGCQSLTNNCPQTENNGRMVCVEIILRTDLIALMFYGFFFFLLWFSLSCSLLETHTGTKQANNLLGEHLHIAVRKRAWR